MASGSERRYVYIYREVEMQPYYLHEAIATMDAGRKLQLVHARFVCVEVPERASGVERS